MRNVVIVNTSISVKLVYCMWRHKKTVKCSSQYCSKVKTSHSTCMESDKV